MGAVGQGRDGAEPAGRGEILVLTGMSGAGRTQAGDVLEDLGWFVIDNLPPALIPRVAELAQAPGGAYERVALVAGAGADPAQLMDALGRLRAGGEVVRIVYLDAATDVLVNRYKDTRRRHPLSDGGSLTGAVQSERTQLEQVKAEADLVIDTTDLNVHQLKSRLIGLFGDTDRPARMQTAVVSFGYKHGVPLDVDVVLDCRFLPNPHWVEELRPLTGKDEPVRAYVLGQEATVEFLARLDDLLDVLLPAYVKEGKAYLTIAMGCTGGRHRSVAIAEELARRLREKGHPVRVAHRDVDR
ncbi:MAG: RNase adapter RapZ [Acidimicrobiales bacterium]